MLAGLDLSLLAGLANAEILEARIGPEQSFDLGFEKDQAERADYASSYDLKLKGVVEPGGALKKAIEMVINDDAVGGQLQGGVFQRPVGVAQGHAHPEQGPGPPGRGGGFHRGAARRTPSTTSCWATT